MRESRRMLTLRYAVLAALMLWTAGPLLYMARVGLSAPGNIHSGTPEWLSILYPFNFVDVLTDVELLAAIARSVAVAFASTLIVLAISTPAAYACAQLDFRGRQDVQFWVLSTRMLPAVVVVIPYFVLFRAIGLQDTIWALIIMHTVINVALVFFMVRSFFAEIPKSVVESAYIDGCTRWQAFRSIGLPLVRTGIAAAGILAFIFSWTELVFALTLASGSAKTAPVAMLGFIQFQSVALGPLMAAATILILPIAILLVIVQKHLVRGLSFGAVTGE
jgi:multiple sugar transport system permease protein